MSRIFTPSGSTVSIDVTATPQSLTIVPVTGDESVRFVNVGTQVVFVNLIATALVSTAVPLLPGTSEVFGLQGTTSVSVVAAAVGSKLYATLGKGI